MSWTRIGVKLLVGIVFSIIAIVAYTYYCYGDHCWDVLYFNTKSLVGKFIMFFIVGYFVIGNSFAPLRKEKWK